LQFSVQLQEQFKDTGKVFNTVGKTTLKQLIGILNACSFSIGPDSGPGHICSALDKRYVSLFGPTTPERVAAFGNEDLVIRVSLGCAPCMKRECPKLGTLCMKLLTPQKVFNSIKQFVALSKLPSLENKHG
jgi:heptosyltransferase II